MQDVRLGVGEGPLSASEVLAGVNAELRRRARLQDREGGVSCPSAVSVEAVAAIIRDECFEVRDGELQGSNEAAARIIERFQGKA